MKNLLVSLLCLGAMVNARAIPIPDWQSEYATLLRKYAEPDGVRYSAWKKNAEDMAAIQRVVDGIARDERKDLPFYLNAYNAWILHEALAKYPTKSVKDTLFTFFLTDRIRVGGQKMSFNKLEKEVIRGKFKEPRIHFALNCASRSCPPLLPEPFASRKLDAQLEGLAKTFANSESGVQMRKNGVALSKIFDWYQEDFGGTPAVISFLNKRRSHPIRADAKITYQDYNWNLNEAR